MKKAHHESSLSNKSLIVIILVFCMMIALIITIIALTTVNHNVQEENDTEDPISEPTYSNTNHDLTEEEREYINDVVSNDASYRISLKIANVYFDDEDKDGALKMYDEELIKALEAKDYGLFVELLSTRSTMLESDDRCDDAVTFFDTIDVSKLPEDYQIAVYEVAAVESDYCNNTERAAYWSSKANEQE